MYKNLQYVIHQKRISIKLLAEFLNVSEKTVHNKLNKKSDFTWSEVEKISTMLCPEYNVNYLFATDDEIIDR